MEKIKNVKEFVEKIDSAKKINPKDLSADQDLSIAIMNLISIEEHLMFSGAKTQDTTFYDLIEEIREIRKTLMQKLIPAYEGEVWCISKHLLASSMRLMEVGTKQLSLKNTKEAYDLFNKSYELYCLFWGLNMNIISTKDIKWVETSKDEIKNIISKSKTKEEVENINTNNIETTNTNEENLNNKISTIDKLKNFVKKAVNCCIE
ncbi:MAG: hypothetical protein PHY80_05620 [Rickettsiales bacterium]|nr:hypothetical protein [Rickettsiales bacterium]